MKERKPSIDRLIHDSELALSGIEEIDSLTDAGSRQVEQEIHQEKIRSLEKIYELPTDGYVEISISADEMTVTADFHPPQKGGNPIDPDSVMTILNDLEVLHGADRETVQGSVFRCNIEEAQLAGIVIARGRDPITEIPKHLVIEDHLQALPAPSTLAAGDDAVDFKQFSPFMLVRKGDVLACLDPGRPGAMGMTVKGKAVPFHRARMPQIHPKANTEADGDTIVAACDGRFERTADSFWVSKVLKVDGNIDYRTGNINFSGDVIIGGEVSDGFSVLAEGSIFCQKTLMASEVRCRQDLYIRLGIIGRKTGKVTAGGNVQTRFIEHCLVRAHGAIQVERIILNSVVQTRDRLVLGQKGIISGSRIWAQNGIVVTQVGTPMGAPTEIRCGVDFEVQEKLEWIKNKMIELATQLSKIDSAIRKSPSNSRLHDAKRNMKAAQQRLTESARTLIMQLDRNEEARIVVRGTVLSGTYLEICHVSHIVKRDLRQVSFWLDKTKGAIAIEPLFS